MSAIGALIERLCPDGVEFRPLSDVVLNFDSQRRPVTRADRRPGPFPYYGANGIQDYVDDFIFDGVFLLVGEDGSVVQKDGSPVVNWATGKIWVNNHAHILASKTDDLELRFLYYYMQTIDITLYVTGSTQPKLNQGNLNRIPIPVPPLEVQEEIVRLLDSFRGLELDLEGELGAELEARQLQYAYYRDSVMTFRETVRTASLGDLGMIFGGLTGKSKADFSDGEARFVSYVNVYNNVAVDVFADDFVRIEPGERQRSLKRGDIIFTGSSETPDDVAISSVVTRELTEPLYLNSFCIGFRLTDESVLDPEFSKHLFRSGVMRRQLVLTANGVTRFNVSKAQLAKVLVPIPAIDQQRRIASLLDNFEALVNSLSDRLPAERRVRRMQYEYYRDKLLTFEEAVA